MLRDPNLCRPTATAYTSRETRSQHRETEARTCTLPSYVTIDKQTHMRCLHGFCINFSRRTIHWMICSCGVSVWRGHYRHITCRAACPRDILRSVTAWRATWGCGLFCTSCGICLPGANIRAAGPKTDPKKSPQMAISGYLRKITSSRTRNVHFWVCISPCLI